MKNIVTVLLAVMVVGSVGFFALKSTNASRLVGKDGINKVEVVMENPDGSMVEEDETMMEEGQRYLDYSPEAFVAANSTRRVLFFHANWCPTCGPADVSFIEGMEKIPSDVTVFKVDYNDTETDQLEEDLAEEYGVTYQHTFVQVDEGGKDVVRWNGGGLDEMLDKIQ
jgi:thioredoxin 1